MVRLLCYSRLSRVKIVSSTLDILNNKAAVANLVIPFGEEWRRTIRFRSKRTGVVQDLSTLTFTGEIRTEPYGGTLLGSFTFIIAVDNLSYVVFISDSDISSIGFDLLYYDMFYTAGSAAPIKFLKGTLQVDTSVTQILNAQEDYFIADTGEILYFDTGELITDP